MGRRTMKGNMAIIANRSWIDTTRAARVMGMTPGHVRNWIRDGRIPRAAVRRVGGAYFLDESVINGLAVQLTTFVRRVGKRPIGVRESRRRYKGSVLA